MLMRILWLAGITYAIFAGQTTLAGELAIAGIVPHLVWVALLVIASRLDHTTVRIVAGLWGLWIDLLGENRLGFHLVSFVLAAELVRRATANRWLDTPGKLALASLPLIGLAMAGKHYGDALSAAQRIPVTVVAITAAGTAFYSAVLVLVMSTLWQRLTGRSTGTSGPAGPIVSNQWRMLTG